jgi:hypothetical protein
MELGQPPDTSGKGFRRLTDSLCSSSTGHSHPHQSCRGSDVRQRDGDSRVTYPPTDRHAVPDNNAASHRPADPHAIAYTCGADAYAAAHAYTTDSYTTATTATYRHANQSASTAARHSHANGYRHANQSASAAARHGYANGYRDGNQHTDRYRDQHANADRYRDQHANAHTNTHDGAVVQLPVGLSQKDHPQSHPGRRRPH